MPVYSRFYIKAPAYSNSLLFPIYFYLSCLSRIISLTIALYAFGQEGLV